MPYVTRAILLILLLEKKGHHIVLLISDVLHPVAVSIILGVDLIGVSLTFPLFLVEAISLLMLDLL